MKFHSPWAFALLVLPCAFVMWRLWRRNTAAAPVTFSSDVLLDGLPRTLRERLAWVPAALGFFGMCLLIVALARPQEGTGTVRTTTDGVAMMLVLDRSGSMSENMIYKGEQRPRMEVVKEVARLFIEGDGQTFQGRENDLVGLVSFAFYADTICPLVSIHSTLLEFIDALAISDSKQLAQTAIGDGIALAAARLKTAEESLARRNEGEQDPEFEIKSKVIILLTDGEENAGDISFAQSAELCKELGIKLYAIGIGGGTYRDMLGRIRRTRSPADVPSFRANAELTGGIAAGASTGEELLAIYERINELETTEIESVEYTDYHESYFLFALIGLAFVLAEAVLSWTVFRRAGA